MSISNGNNRNQYTSGAAQDTFAYTFKIETANDLKVYLTANGTDPDDSADLVSIANYSVTGLEADGGGNVVLDTPANAGDVITIIRSIIVKQPDVYAVGQDHAEELEASLDRTTTRLQMIEERVNRSVKVHASSDGTEYLLPKPVADEMLGWNAGGTGLENKSADDILAGALSAAQAAAAQAVAAAASVNGYTTLTSSTAITLALDGNQTQHCTALTHNPTLDGSGYGAGQSITALLTASGGSRTVTYDPQWHAMGVLPTVIPTGKTLLITLASTTGLDTGTFVTAVLEL